MTTMTTKADDDDDNDVIIMTTTDDNRRQLTTTEDDRHDGCRRRHRVGAQVAALVVEDIFHVGPRDPAGGPAEAAERVFGHEEEHVRALGFFNVCCQPRAHNLLHLRVLLRAELNNLKRAKISKGTLE